MMQHLVLGSIFMVAIACGPKLEGLESEVYTASDQVYPFGELGDVFAVRFLEPVEYQEITFGLGDIAWAYRETGTLAAANLYGPHHLMGHMWPRGTTVEFHPDRIYKRFRTQELARVRDAVCNGKAWIDVDKGKLSACTLAENYQWGTYRNFIAGSRVVWNDQEDELTLTVILSHSHQFGSFGFQKDDTVFFRRDGSLSRAQVISSRVLPNFRCGAGVWTFETDQVIIDCPKP